MSKRKKVVKRKSFVNLKKIEKPAFLRFLGYIADTQGCGTIRCIYPYLLLNHIMEKDLRVNATYMVNFIPQPEFYKDFTLVQFQRSATKQHLEMFKYFKQNISPVAKVPLIYEIDDLLINIPKWNYAAEYYNKNEEYVKKIISLADGVVTSTLPLLKIYSEFNKNITVILNHLPKFIWGDIYPAHDYYDEKNKIKILWAGSANHFTLKHLYEKGIYGGDFSKKLMDFIKKTTDNYEWIFMGAMPLELDSIKDKIKFVKWVDVFNYPRKMKSLEPDIGIAPLVKGKFNESKCITRDSLVPTDNGIKFIDEIFVGYSINKEKIKNTIEYKNEKTIRLKTKWGFEIEGTYNHKLFHERWKRLDEFKLNEDIKINSFEIKNKKIKKFTNSKNNVTISIDKDLASLLGYILINGYYYFDEINISSKDGNFIIPITKILERKSIKYEILSHDINNIVKFKDNELLEIIKNLWCFGNNKIKKIYTQIPNLILESPKNIIKEFIKSIFDICGYIKDFDIFFKFKSEYFTKQIQFLLLGFGVLSEIIKTDFYYNLHIKSNKRFLNKIGSNCKVKSNKIFIACNNNYNLYEYEENWVDKIVNISYHINDVYDIELESHKYNANGFISHNSNIKQLEFVASGMPGVYTDIYPYKNTTLKAKNDEEMIGYIEKLAGDIDFRKKVFYKDYDAVKSQLWWEENNNLKKYINSYLNLFGKKL